MCGVLFVHAEVVAEGRLQRRRLVRAVGDELRVCSVLVLTLKSSKRREPRERLVRTVSDETGTDGSHTDPSYETLRLVLNLLDPPQTCSTFPEITHEMMFL